MQQDIICGLDIGSSSIRVLISSVRDSNILGYADCPTKGLSKGMVSNLVSLSDSIEMAMAKAEEGARLKVRKVITDISGTHIRTIQSRGSIYISDRPSEIKRHDITRCIESARLIAMSLDREPLHIIPVKFFIDDKIEVVDPLGLFASRLDVELNIITGLSTIIQNIIKAVNIAGYEVEEMIIRGLATGLAIFDRRELEDGAIVIDVGKEVTEIAIFMDGRFHNVLNFQFGGDDLTKAIQDELRIMFNEADELRMKYGIVTKDISRLDDIEIPLHRGATISRTKLADIMFPKIESAFKDIYKQLEPILKMRKSPLHLRIIGGVSKMDGFIETVEEILGIPTEIGRLDWTNDAIDISFASSRGLTRYGIQKISPGPEQIHKGNIFVNGINKIKRIFSEYF